MITTVNLVSVHHLTELQFFFLVMRTFKIYCLRDFPIHNTVLLTIVTMLYITSPGLTYLIAGSWYLLATFTLMWPNCDDI